MLGTLSNSCLLYKVQLEHKANFGGLSDVKVLLQKSVGICLLKIIKLDSTWQTCCPQ